MTPLTAPAPYPHAGNASPCDKLRPMPLTWITLKLGLDRASPLLADHPDSPTLLRRLEQTGRVDAALRLAAHALPAREAVWWACRCAYYAGDSERRSALDAAAAEAAEAWVRQPGSARRAKAYAAAQRAQFQSAEALAALAAFWSGAQAKLSMRPEAAAAQLCQSVEHAVRLAGYRGAPAARPQRQRQFLASARDIAAGGAGHISPANEA
ncbi:hypothetical protein ACELLULO517_12390 [Acidisoma cellulosilytica]|uniref:Uncharacterized protein n=1 Tax=Acidisoma cellulosilyticum TaxID=2802395 RepID=A0A963Z1Z0_9PROT|nr:hypothetical protein [Acidisoma cellulosilyticum]MCB8881036.1 hypothetical protein [Acidisoma cellulosilyticum]